MQDLTSGVFRLDELTEEIVKSPKESAHILGEVLAELIKGTYLNAFFF